MEILCESNNLYLVQFNNGELYIITFLIEKDEPPVWIAKITKREGKPQPESIGDKMQTYILDDNYPDFIKLVDEAEQYL